MWQLLVCGGCGSHFQNGGHEFSMSHISSNKAAFTRAILRVGGRLHLTTDTQKTVGWRVHGGIRYGALSSQRSHSNAYAVLSPLAATLLMAQTQSIIVTCTGVHAFGMRSQVWRR